MKGVWALDYVPFLERIFSLNAPLMGRATPEEVGKLAACPCYSIIFL